MEERNWIVLSGQPIDTTKGGGFEFFGPYTEKEADEIKEAINKERSRLNQWGPWITTTIQLLKQPPL